jgi:acyl carrier protein
MTNSETTNKILTLLAQHLGVEVEDISLDDSFEDDLNMSSIDLSDFAHVLEKEGYEVSPEEIVKFENPGELADFLSIEDNY